MSDLSEFVSKAKVASISCSVKLRVDNGQEYFLSETIEIPESFPTHVIQAYKLCKFYELKKSLYVTLLKLGVIDKEKFSDLMEEMRSAENFYKSKMNTNTADSGGKSE